jgi:ABC-2 type transport system permease protein
MNALVTLLVQRLRRDRLQLLIWIIGIALLALFSVSAVEKTYGDPAGRENILQLAVANPSILMLRGTPEGGRLDQFVFFEIFTFIAVLAGPMNTFLSVRHSRAEEESGRAELLASTPAGRTLPTVATIIYGALVNVVNGLFVALAFLAGGLDAKGSFVAGCATAAVGLTFLAVGLFAAQLMRTSRGANGVAAAAVIAAYFIRGIGDALGTPSADHLHMTVAWWSWASPIGWGQQTLAYDANTLTPLLLNLALTAALLSLVFVLQAQRDSGASLLAGRLGRVDARTSLSTSLGLAWRLQWAHSGGLERWQRIRRPAYGQPCSCGRRRGNSRPKCGEGHGKPHSWRQRLARPALYLGDLRHGRRACGRLRNTSYHQDASGRGRRYS